MYYTKGTVFSNIYSENINTHPHILVFVYLCICVFVYDRSSYAECVLGAPVWLDRLAPVAAPGSQEGSPPLLLRSPLVVAMMNRTMVFLVILVTFQTFDHTMIHSYEAK